MAIDTHETHDLEGRTVYSSDGEKLGKIDEIHSDERGGPQYIEVKSGWLGTKHHLIPAAGLTRSGDDLAVPYTRSQLEAAPTYDGGEDVDYERERDLGSHYGHDVRGWETGRDDWLAGEDLSRGPTPETRHPEGGRDDIHDTTEGPTPETRRAERASHASDPGASGQSRADRGTRQDGGGTQDLRDEDTDSRLRDEGTDSRRAEGGGRQVRLRRSSRAREEQQSTRA